MNSLTLQEAKAHLRQGDIKHLAMVVKKYRQTITEVLHFRRKSKLVAEAIIALAIKNKTEDEHASKNLPLRTSLQRGAVKHKKRKPKKDRKLPTTITQLKMPL